MRLFGIPIRLPNFLSDALHLNAAVETLRGYDGSHYDWMTQDGDYIPIDFDFAYLNGSRFAILKVVNGAVIQEHAVDELTRANASPLHAMPYMWPYPVKNISAVSQASKWYEVMRNFPGMTIALDAEETPGYSNPQGSDHEAVIREYWKLVPGQRFILYSRLDYIISNGFNNSFFAQFPLWLARPGIYEPIVPSAWKNIGKTWTVWQDKWNGDPARNGVRNGKKAVDENQFNGNETQLAELFGGEVVIPPPGGTMNYKITRVPNTPVTTVTNIRATGGAALGADIGDFKNGQVGLGTEVLGSPTGAYYCLKVTSGADVVGWVYSRWNGNPTYAVIEVVPEPPLTKPVLHLSAGADGYETKTFDLNPLT